VIPRAEFRRAKETFERSEPAVAWETLKADLDL